MLPIPSLDLAPLHDLVSRLLALKDLPEIYVNEHIQCFASFGQIDQCHGTGGYS